MTTSIAETQQTAKATATAPEPKGTTKANAAPRKPRVAPSKAKSYKKTASAKKAPRRPKKPRRRRLRASARAAKPPRCSTYSNGRAEQR